ncbi:hypothetical protein AMATHDRAFT_137825 [Amanita thiersii Skay4041]|uniref:HRDC domain-containing protein n=1 Tax=Amanita thiersii Skay4041 TaxID=703135 RepID=A0A2A9NZ95_9AGAR|nr:hypothetical protein AMATHDRAFT_137825 [Amanita thiersii Skay4041]
MDTDPSSFDQLNKNLQQYALKATRHALHIPSDVAFHRSMDSTLGKDIDAVSVRILALTNSLLSLGSNLDLTIEAKGRGQGKSPLENQDDVVDSFHSLVVDPVDRLLERTDMCLDEYLGRTKPPAIIINPTISNKPAKKSMQAFTGHLDPALQHAAHISKPQQQFKRKPDNSDGPWYPSLFHKYNAKVPLGYDYRDPQEQGDEAPIQNHPYRYEIVHFTPPQHMFVSQTSVSPLPLSATPYTWVSTLDAFQAMLSKLRQVQEIAVDLEHHNYRTYSGFVCLMQLSTRQEDWIVDTLALREELVELNEVFTDPEIVKVFHGAESDIVWLQQDFNLYVVNLFDTFHASKLLDFPRHGLANLLEMYCDIIPDKKYQLADWRIRPLPEEMIQYARSDTHFLLYIYDCLRNALIDRSRSSSPSGTLSSWCSSTPVPASGTVPSLLLIAISRSRDTSLRTYQKEMYDTICGSGPNGWDTLARKWNKPLLLANNDSAIGKVQRSIYYSTHAWRDKVAREEDESIRYVLPNHYLFLLAEQPPSDMATLLKAFPSGPPPVIRRRAQELLDVVREALKASSLSALPTDAANNENNIAASQSSDSIHSETAADEEANCNVQLLQRSVAEIDIWTISDIPKAVNGSSLFKSKSSPVPAPNVKPIASRMSSLFGRLVCALWSLLMPSIRFLQDPCRVEPTTRFKDLVSRINSTLVIAPSLTKVCVCELSAELELIPHIKLRINNATEITVHPQTKAEPVTDMLGVDIEIPFISAAERKPKMSDPRTEDTIVVVGQGRMKKRKHKNVALSARANREIANVSDGTTTDNQEDFDFAAASNILDNNSDNEAEERVTKPQKPKKQTQMTKGQFYGEFPAPPKASSEFRRGNQSFTFRK